MGSFEDCKTTRKIVLTSTGEVCRIQVIWRSSGLKIRIVNETNAWCGELTRTEIDDFVKSTGLSAQTYEHDLKAALGKEVMDCDAFIYSIDDDTLLWKKRLSSEIVAKLGHVKLQQVPFITASLEVIDELIDLVKQQDSDSASSKSTMAILKKTNGDLKKLLKETEKEKVECEKTLYGRFLPILNAKKRQIEMLEEETESRPVLKPTSRSQKAGNLSSSSSSPSPPVVKDDPYGEDTDVDGDLDDGAENNKAEESPYLSVLRRRSSAVDNLDSPTSPVAVLPKRSKLVPRATKSGKRTERKKMENVEICSSVTTSVSTQDILNEF